MPARRRTLRLEMVMRIEDIMTDAVRTIPPTTPAADAWLQMQQARVRHLVVTSGSHLAGVVSDRDVGGRRVAMLRDGRTVADLMTRQVVTVSPETTIRRAANLMRGRSIGCLVVTEGDRVLGIVTTADLLELLGRAARSAVWTPLNHRVPHVKQHRTGGSW
jgi:CBS domain-containing protein